MNRPPQHFATPSTAPSTAAVADHPAIWHGGADLPISGGTGSAILGFCSALVMAFPAIGLALLIIIGLGAMQGAPSSDESSFTTAFLALFLVGFAVLMGLVFAWIFSAPGVQAFTVDENQRVLTLIVSRRGRKPTELSVPFSDIFSMRPYVLAAYDRNGYFSVVFQGPKDRVYEYQFAEGTSLEEMEFHAAWLRGMIGERMYELLNLDK